MLEEFKKFALRGNVVDLAVGVIIGAAFGSIVTSAVQDVFMPIIGAITGGLDFSNYYIALSSSVQKGCGLRGRQETGRSDRPRPVHHGGAQLHESSPSCCFSVIPGDEQAPDPGGGRSLFPKPRRT